MFKPKSKKKQRRTLYFAIVVFKNDESVDKILGDSKFLQGKVNRHAKKQIGFMANPFLAGEQDLLNSDSEAEEEVGHKNDKAKMEEGGFTLVEQDIDNPTRTRGRDKYNNAQKGISVEEAEKFVERQESKKTGDGLAYVPNSEKKDKIKQDFYMFQKKIVMKSQLEQLREGFEHDKKRLEKAMRK